MNPTMMMWAHPELRRRAGMGGIGEGETWGIPTWGGSTITIPLLPGQPGYIPTGGAPTTTPAPSSNNYSWWQQLALLAPATVSSIWNTHTVSQSPWGINAALLQHGLYPPNQNQQTGNLTPEQIQAMIAAQNNNNAAGINQFGLNLFGQQIGWGTIALIGGIILLIQMQPVRRR